MASIIDHYTTCNFAWQVGQYISGVVQTISNPDGTVSIVHVDPNNPVITLPDGTQAQVGWIRLIDVKYLAYKIAMFPGAVHLIRNDVFIVMIRPFFMSAVDTIENIMKFSLNSKFTLFQRINSKFTLSQRKRRHSKNFLFMSSS